MADDLNDYNEDLMGHPQIISPNIKKLADSGVSFTNAYSNDPMCGPSRSSMITGVYPHNSSNFWQKPWFDNIVLNNTKTMMEKFLKLLIWKNILHNMLHVIQKMS